MFFSDAPFLVLLPILVIGYWLLPKNLRPILISVYSLLFVASWGIYSLVYLLVAILLNYLLAQVIRYDKRFWSIGVAINIAILLVAQKLSPWFLVGCSYYSLQNIAFLFDVKNKLVTDLRWYNFLHYQLYFPRFTLGPIQRYKHFSQNVLGSSKVFSDIDWVAIVALFSWGLFKKVYCADYLSLKVVDPFLSDSSHYGWLSFVAWPAMSAVQLYFDFSGYSTMAMAIARMFGHEIPTNFNFPFLANSYNDFWNRWHISLSHWLRDIIFFPLQMWWGKKVEKHMIIAFSLVTWAIAGVWHGLQWNYLLYGLLQGLFVAGSTLRKMARPKGEIANANIFSSMIIFSAFSLSMVFFRLNFSQVASLAGSLLKTTGELCLMTTQAYIILVVFVMEHFWGHFRWETIWDKQHSFLKGLIIGLLLLYLFLVAPKEYVSFVYFEF